ncbi:DUF6801 domain-containing protein [Streptomyces sp. cg36]|uniref:DUF6801 domain-containing protein n=1 Tax=Streptomyces sp. cg36 TaxID=3238798 RepID=UPI0034E2EBF6
MRYALGGSAALALTGGVLLTCGAGSAVAVEARLSQTYECAFPLIGADPVKVAITADLPASVPVGTQTGPIRIDALSTVSARAAQGLVGAKTVEGVASASATVNLPGGAQLDVGVDAAVAKADVPGPARDFEVRASGSAPSLSFRTPGSAAIDVNAITLKLTARDATGRVVQLPPYGDVFEAPCVLRPADQNRTLHRFTVTGAGPTGPASPSPTAPTPTGPAPTASAPGSPAPSGPAPTGPAPSGPGGTSGPAGSTPPSGTAGGAGTGGTGTTGGATGTDLVTHVNGPGDGRGSLAGTGTSAAGLLLTGAGLLGAAGIAAVHWLPGRIRGDEEAE